MVYQHGTYIYHVFLLFFKLFIFLRTIIIVFSYYQTNALHSVVIK